MKFLFLCIVNISIFFSSFVFAEDTRSQEFRTQQAPIQIFNLHTEGKITRPIKIIPHTKNTIIVKSNELNNFTMTCIDSLENDVFLAKCTLVEKKIKNKSRQQKINVYRGKIIITDVYNSQINITSENIDEKNETSLFKKIINWFKGQNNIADNDINIYVPMQFILQVTYEAQLSLQINSSKENNTNVFFQSPSLSINKSNKDNEMIEIEDTLERKSIFIKGFFAAMQLNSFSSSSLTIYNFYPYCLYDITSMCSDSNVSMHLVESPLTQSRNLEIISKLEAKRNNLIGSFSNNVKKNINSSINIPNSSLEMTFQSESSNFYTNFMTELNLSTKQGTLDPIFLDQSNNVF